MTLRVLLKSVFILSITFFTANPQEIAAADTTQKAHASSDKTSPSRLLKLGKQLSGIVVGPKEKTVVITSDSGGGSYFRAGDCLEIDVNGALEHLSFKPSFTGLGDGTTNVWIRMAEANDSDTVCKTGQCWGNYKFTSDPSGSFTAVEPKRAIASPKSIKLINNSNFAMCIGISAPAAGTISAAALPVKNCFRAAPCSTPPLNIAGSWKSNYHCNDNCDGSEEKGALRITIAQDAKDPVRASYSDSEGGRYQGSVCGNVFKYTGGGDDWTEGGQIVFDDENSASKSSNYSNHKTCCTGSCSDKIVRVKKSEKS